MEWGFSIEGCLLKRVYSLKVCIVISVGQSSSITTSITVHLSDTLYIVIPCSNGHNLWWSKIFF